MITENGLTPDQLDGVSCVVCGEHLRPMKPVCFGSRGQLFACSEHEETAK